MNSKTKWYNNANSITTLIIIIISLIIVFSQSFALGRNGSLELFTSIINHNSVYLFILIYFIILKLPFGKRYFNYLSVFLIFIYFITAITSFLTLIQAFSLNSVLDFILNLFLLIYLVHTLMRDTRVWREFYISKSPFNEIPNDFMFYSITMVSVILLAVNLISTVKVSGVIMSILDTIYIVLVTRYIYLYRRYLDKKKKDVSEEMNFDDIKKTFNEVDKTVSKAIDDTVKKANDYIKEKEIDKKYDKVREEVINTTKEIGKDIDNGIKKAKKEIKKATKSTTKKGEK